MTNTRRTQAELLTIYADNNSGNVSAQDGRDFIVSSKLLGMADDNILINQDFSIWQENTTFANPADGVYTADGHYVGKVNGGGTAPSINVKKNTTDMETGFKQCMELEITNVGVAGTTRNWSNRQSIEDFEKYRGKTVTVSIRVKASAAITLNTGRIFIWDGVAGVNIPITSITTSWATYSATLTVDDAAILLELRGLDVVTLTGTISTTGSIYIQYMKLELGSVATPLIPRSTGEELRLCQRYYQKSYAQGVFAGAVTSLGAFIHYLTAVTNADYTMYMSLKLPIIMKAAPTVTLYDTAGNPGKVTMAAGDNIAGTITQCDSGFFVSATNGAVASTRHLEFHYTAISRV